MAKNATGTALVTGASAGIGAVYADRLARRGYDLILVARNAGKMETLAARLRAETGRSVEVLPADLSERADTARIAERLASDADITLLVNNAGITLKGGVLDNGAEALERLIAVNVTAPTLLATAAAKAFVSRRAGKIVNISSVLALAPEMLEGAYSGTKAYLLNLSLKLGLDTKEAGVHVQAVLPGATRTDLWEQAGIDADAAMPGMVMDAGDLVDAALLGLERGETVTIPPLADEGAYVAYNDARLALAPQLSRKAVGARYLVG